jgi:translation initiation factor 1
MARNEGGDRLVYSSEHGRVCPSCGRSETRCNCRGKGARARIKARDEAAAAKASDGIVRVDADTLRDLAADLKRSCSTGGALKDGVIEIQGDHRDTLVAELEKRGFKVKRAG